MKIFWFFISDWLEIDQKVELQTYIQVHQNFLNKGSVDFDLKKYAFDIRFDQRFRWDPIEFKQIIYYLNECDNQNDKILFNIYLIESKIFCFNLFWYCCDNRVFSIVIANEQLESRNFVLGIKANFNLETTIRISLSFGKINWNKNCD